MRPPRVARTSCRGGGEMSAGAKTQIGSGRFIVMLGTSFDTRGGVSSVVNVYRQHGLFERWPIIYLPTHCDGSAAGKLALVARSLVAYAWLLLRGRVAIVHVHASSWISFWRKLPFFLLACAARKPFIFHLHGGNFDGFYAAMGSLRKWLIRFVLDHAARIVVLSSQWSTWVHGVSMNSQVVCIHNPVAVPAEAAPLAQQQRLLFLGRMNRGKGIYDLLDVVAGLRARHPALRLTCAGDGEAEQVGARARELGIGDAVEIPGWVSAQERDALIATSTILVLPSYFEGLPMSVLEAMAAGMPAVATPVGGIPDLIEDGVDGYMVMPGDHQALARVLDRLLADPALQQQVGAAARRKIEEGFSADVVVPRLEKLYAELQVAPASNLSRPGTARAARV